MGPAQAIRAGFAKSLQFSGTANRSEFCWFASVWTVPIVALVLLLKETKPLLVTPIYLAAIVPMASAAARRLRDVGISAWALLAPALLVVGAPVLLCVDGVKFQSKIVENLYLSFGFLALFVGPALFLISMPLLMGALAFPSVKFKPLST